MQRLGLACYCHQRGHGHIQARKPVRVLLWAILGGHGQRRSSFLAIESLVRSGARRLDLDCGFGDDTLGYFTGGLDPEPPRQASRDLLRQTKRNKAFDGSPRIGLAVEGTTVGRGHDSGGTLCRPYRNASHEIVAHRHPLSSLPQRQPRDRGPPAPPGDDLRSWRRSLPALRCGALRAR